MRENTPEKITTFDAIRISLASPEQILSWSHGEVTKPETINYRTQKPEKDGLFCERIFGPTKDWECYCGKYKKIRYKGIICDKCGVQVTRSIVRRERLGHIKLAAPVVHVWYLRGVPSRIGLYVGISVRDLEKVVYFASFIVMAVDENKKQEILQRIHQEFEDFKKEAHKELERKEKDIDKDIATAFRENKDASKKDVEKKMRDELKVWKKEMNEKKDEMQSAYDEAKSEVSGITKYAILSEAKYSDLRHKYGSFFKAGIGAEAILELVKEVDIQKLAQELEKEKNAAAGQRRKKIMKRLRFVRGFIKAKLDPQWMILSHIAVTPPDLRPMVQLDGGRFATSDLNDLYRRVINRNNRLKRLQELKAPEVIQRNEKRMLQESVDALIGTDSQRGRAAVTAGGRRKLKSLSEGLKGKQGRFRQNLLGKRVDYSGRSVIVVGPDLHLDECGLPKKMALELFKPFIISELIAKGFTHSAKSAAKLIDAGISEVWDILEEVTKKHYVLLNRAPTLHRLGIQAFKVKLIEGKAIRIHPLVCAPFNADFDGDQMAVHVPLSRQAQEEAMNIMLSSKNLLRPSDGTPSIAPSQDIVLGCYYMTSVEKGALGEGRVFAHKNEAIIAYQLSRIHLRADIRVVIDGALLNTTVGRILFNEIMPIEFGFINETLVKSALGDIIARSFRELGIENTAAFVDKIKNIGIQMSTMSGVTIAVDDLKIPATKDKYVGAADKEADKIDQQYKQGLITANEKYLKNIEVWTQTKEKIEGDMLESFDENNPVYIMYVSKARGSKDQLSRMVSMRGLLQDPSGNIIALPIRSNFKEGLTVLEYFISSHGARKGLADTALRTSDAGYLTRRLVDVAQDIIITEIDCGTEDGLIFSKSTVKDIDADFVKRLDGRIAAADIKGEKGKIILKRGEEINHSVLQEIVKDKVVDEVSVRTVLECKSTWGVCQTCYGKDLSRGRVVQLGEAVGIMAAQSIGEPGTQLTMRTFHSGGIAKRDITQGLPRVEELVEARTPKSPAIIAEIAGTIQMREDKDGNPVVYILSKGFKKDIIPIPKEAKVFVKDGDKVDEGATILQTGKAKHIRTKGKATVAINKEAGEITLTYNKKDEKVYEITADMELIVEDGQEVAVGDPLIDGHIDLHQLFAILGSSAVKRYIVKEIQEIYESQGQSINDKHLEIIIRQMFSKVRVVNPGGSEYLEGELIERSLAYVFNQGAKAHKKKELIVEDVLLGVTKAALNTESFLSAASFQETTSILIDAATAGKMDYLRGLKENTILGKLIPAGTGFRSSKKQVVE